MKILFVHPNMPGQYRNLCRVAAADPKNTVVFLTKRTKVEIPGVHKVEYQPSREPSAATHRYIIGVERSILQGQECWRTCKKLEQEEGFKPDIIVAHPGWGDALYLKDLWPDVPLLSYFEFYYHGVGVDVGFDPKEPATDDDKARVRTKNLTNMMNLEACDWGVSPTHWQKSVHPLEFQPKISVLHDGIDCDAARPNEDVTVTLASGKILTRKDEVITYIARNMEPYRGFPTFMQAAEIILKNRPNAHIIAIGADGVSYGKNLPKGQTYLGQWKEKVKLDYERIHFVGTLDYGSLIQALQLSSAHIYMTYPFVLSWSALEAMAAGCLMIASDTAPVKEVIQHGHNGLLFDFFSPELLAARVDQVFAHKDRMAELRRNARQTILDKYDVKKLLPIHMDLISDVAKGDYPPLAQQKIDALYKAA